MSHWNHRVCKSISKVDRGNGEVTIITYGIHEVYYLDNGEVYGVTEEPTPIASYHDSVLDEGTPENCLEELQESVKRVQRAMELPVIDLDTLKYAKEGT